MLIRLPQELADDLNARLENPNSTLPNLTLTPDIKIDNDFDVLQFKYFYNQTEL